MLGIDKTNNIGAVRECLEFISNYTYETKSKWEVHSLYAECLKTIHRKLGIRTLNSILYDWYVDIDYVEILEYIDGELVGQDFEKRCGYIGLKGIHKENYEVRLDTETGYKIEKHSFHRTYKTLKMSIYDIFKLMYAEQKQLYAISQLQDKKTEVFRTFDRMNTRSNNRRDKSRINIYGDVLETLKHYNSYNEEDLDNLVTMVEEDYDNCCYTYAKYKKERTKARKICSSIKKFNIYDEKMKNHGRTLSLCMCDDIQIYKDSSVCLTNEIGMRFINLICAEGICTNCFSEDLDYLKGIDGRLCMDYTHVYLLYEYLRSKKKNSVITEGILFFYAFYEMYTVRMEFKRRKFNVEIDKKIKYLGVRHNFYDKYFTKKLLLPEGYKGYTFEPNNLVEISYMANINNRVLTVENMVSEYNKSKMVIEDRETGILYDFLRLEYENRILADVLKGDFNVDVKNGEYSHFYDLSASSSEHIENKNIYSDMIKPFMWEIMGSHIRRKFIHLLNVEGVILYYLTESCLGIAVREDLDLRDYVSESVFDSLNELSGINKLEVFYEHRRGDYHAR